ncbi:conserved membrane hypothetical protein [Candidatus Sulfopaludibacter sp. SbA3]|nr:conserved membrane hypothetical protein [Candidatus Sulfopaludibacter sp. SbA3]
MNMAPTLEWIESTDLSTAIREGALLYPIIGGFHLLAIALFGGMLVATDLRLLGWAMQRRAVSDIIEQTRLWKRIGFVLVMASGLLLAWAEPLKLYRSPSFWVKMALFALVGVHALVFRRTVYGNPQHLDKGLTLHAKLAAILSLLLWAGLIVSGRLIAFDA